MKIDDQLYHSAALAAKALERVLRELDWEGDYLEVAPHLRGALADLRRLRAYRRDVTAERRRRALDDLSRADSNL